MVPRVSPIESASRPLAGAVRALRDEQELTQEDVAYEAGITPGSLSRIEGAKSNPTWTTVERIAEALGVTLTQLAAAVERHAADD